MSDQAKADIYSFEDDVATFRVLAPKQDGGVYHVEAFREDMKFLGVIMLRPENARPMHVYCYNGCIRVRFAATTQVI